MQSYICIHKVTLIVKDWGSSFRQLFPFKRYGNWTWWCIHIILDTKRAEAEAVVSHELWSSEI